MAYDEADGYVLLFGGENASAYLGDTWNFTNGNWTRLNVSSGPANRSEASMTYDEADGYVLLFGGTSSVHKAWGDTWTFQAGHWTNVTASAGPAPSPRFGASMVYDGADHYVLLFGGESPNGTVLTDAWTFHGGKWSRLGNFPQVAGLETQMVYDPVDGYVLAFGAGNASSGGGNLTWKFQKGTWTELFPKHSPSVRTEESLSFDPKDGYVMLYGGVNNTTTLSDTWKFAYGQWYQLLPTVNPGPLAFSGESAPYDLADGYVVLFGGSALMQPPGNTTWIYGASPNTALYACRSFGGPQQSACVYSEYGKYFLTNVSWEPDIFGVEAENNSTYATSVTGIIGSVIVPFSHQNNSSLWWNSTVVSMGSFQPGAVLNVTIVFPGTTFVLSLPFSYVWNPPWLEDINSHSYAGFVFQPEGTSTWNNPYSIDVAFPAALSDWLSMFLPSSIPASLLSGSYRLFPEIEVDANFSSAGHLRLDTLIKVQAPPVNISVASVKVTVEMEASAKGYFIVKSSSLLLQYADLTAGASFKFSYRLAGWSEEADIGSCKFGMDIGPSIFAEVGFAVTLDLAPAPPGTPVGNMLPGLGLVITGLDLVTIALTFGVSFGGSLDICNLSLFSLDVEGSITLDLFVQPQPLQISGGNVTGEVQWSGCAVVLCAGGYLLGPATIYSWGQQSSGSVGPPPRVASNASVPVSNWSLMPRTYNVSQYLQPTWTTGSDNGSLIPIFFPHSAYALAAGSAGPLLLYTYDNVSRNESLGYSMQGIAFQEPNGRMVQVPAPSTPNSLPMNPSLLALPDGSVQAVWDAVPDSEARTANPFDFNPVFLDSAVYDPSTGSWGPVSTLTSHGVATSSRLGFCGATPTALVVMNDPVNQTESLDLIDLANGTSLRTVNAPGTARVTGFDCAASLASLSLNMGGTELLDLATGKPIPLPQLSGYNQTALDLIPASLVGILFENQSQDVLELWNATSGAMLAQGTLPYNATAVKLVSTAVGTIAVVQLADAIEMILASNGTWVPLRTVHYGHIQSFETSFDGVSLYTAVLVENGNLSYPESSLDWNVLPLFPAFMSSARVLDAGETFTLTAARSQVPDVTGYLWSGLPAGCNTYSGLTLLCALSAGTYHVNVTAVLTNGERFPSQSLLLTVNPDPSVTLTGPPGPLLPGSQALVTSAVRGGIAPYTYAWFLNGTAVPNATGPSTGFALPEPGNYTVSVEVTDAAGMVVLGFYQVSAASPPPPPPPEGGLPVWDLLLPALLAFGGASLVMAAVVLFLRKRASFAA